MIYFISDFTSIEEAIRRIGSCYPDLTACVRFFEYSALLTRSEFPTGTYVFTGTLGFGAERLVLALSVERTLDRHSKGVTLLNRPSRLASSSLLVRGAIGGMKLKEASNHSERGFQVRVWNRPANRPTSSCSGNDLALAISEEILTGAAPEDIRLWAGDPLSTTFLVIQGNPILLTSGHEFPRAYATGFGFDLICLESSDRQLISATDDLDHVIPRVVPGSRLAMELIKFIASLDTPIEGEFEVTPLESSELAQALNLSGSSSA